MTMIDLFPDADLIEIKIEDYLKSVLGESYLDFLYEVDIFNISVYDFFMRIEEFKKIRK